MTYENRIQKDIVNGRHRRSRLSGIGKITLLWEVRGRKSAERGSGFLLWEDDKSA